MDQETHETKRIGDSLSQVNGITGGNSSILVKGGELDTALVTNSDETSGISRENGDSVSKIDEVVSSKALLELSETMRNHGPCNYRIINENSSNSDREVSLETLVVRNFEPNRSSSTEKGDFGLRIDEIGSSGTVGNEPDTCNRRWISERMGQIDSGGGGNSGNLVDAVVLETVVVNKDHTACLSMERRELDVKSNELGSSNALLENLKGKASVAEKESCVIDVECDSGDGKHFKESSDGERVCRICHLSSEQASETAATTNTTSTTNFYLILLGCGCKDELGIAHSHCAEAWFKLKGNRLCEICGQTAKNVTGVGDCRFTEDWNGGRFIGSSSSSERGGCWRGQPFCNFLMACLVIAFVLPWFFRVNMF